ncbi:unnamed protein product [Aphanomyces euteiches]|uniref:Uncharacterized protein n=1 Tax=Aphanomyces euteiches TaxID=100861 RepID=A0A6G0XBE2_9STRA|nr:hypothetical protein Ae201684_006553 [Aphanomyces euteiches]KAH9091026.1 hypothetical protein Ae201684P_006427 [Aphanomyces euteiches]
MQVTLAVHGLSFPVACGEGMQSVKWLGLVAAQRYALMLPHGRCRTREDAHSKNGFYLPSEVRNSEGELLSPWSRIVECCRENETITIVLQHEVPVDEIGVPQLTPWAISAFSKDNNVHDIVTDGDEENDDEKDSVQPNNGIYSDMLGYSTAFHANHIKSGQFISQDELESAFYHDLTFLKLDDFVNDQRDKDDVEDILLKYYDCLVAIYKHYSLGFGEDSYAMSAIEFSHFVHESSLMHYIKDANLIDKVVGQVSAGDTSALALTRAGFIQTLIRVVVTYNKTYGDDIPFPAALEKALKENIKPACLRLTSGPFRDTFHSDAILAMFQEAKPKLAKVYDKYASMKHKSSSRILCVSDFRSLIQDSGIFCTGDSDRHEQLFDEAIQQCFIGMKEIKDAEKQLLVFTEYIEVICRLSLGIWEDKEVSDKETIRIGLDAVRALANAK